MNKHWDVQSERPGEILLESLIYTVFQKKEIISAREMSKKHEKAEKAAAQTALSLPSPCLYLIHIYRFSRSLVVNRSLYALIFSFLFLFSPCYHYICMYIMYRATSFYSHYRFYTHMHTFITRIYTVLPPDLRNTMKPDSFVFHHVPFLQIFKSLKQGVILKFC